MGEQPPNGQQLEISIGTVVRAWREHRGWTVTEFAELARLPKGHVSEVENDKIGQPKGPTLRKLATALGVSEWDLHTRRLPPPKAVSPSGSSHEQAGDDRHRRSEAIPGRTASASSGALGSPLGLTTPDQTFRSASFGARVEQVVAEAGLPYGTRRRLEHAIIEVTKTLCRIAKDEGR